MKGLGPALVVGAALLSVSACGTAAPEPLSHTTDSVHALAETVVAGFQRADARRLTAVALSEQEFRDHVWAGLPVSRPERNMPIEYVWADLAAKSRGYMALAQRRSVPASIQVARVAFDGGVTHYEGFSVHRKARLIVRDAKGVESSLRLFGSVLEKDGRFKVFSYVTD